MSNSNTKTSYWIEINLMGEPWATVQLSPELTMTMTQAQRAAAMFVTRMRSEDTPFEFQLLRTETTAEEIGY